MKDVRVPEQLQRAMAAEAEAAREARAKVIAAEGEHKASRALRHAAEVIIGGSAAEPAGRTVPHTGLHSLRGRGGGEIPGFPFFRGVIGELREFFNLVKCRTICTGLHSFVFISFVSWARVIQRYMKSQRFQRFILSM